MDVMKPLEIVFKEADGLEISMDVYIPEGATVGSPAPVVLWWHGGGLLQGTKKGTSPHQLSSPLKHNLCFISADYRLAPQTRLPGILADCKDAISFIRSPKFASLTSNRIDASKLILSGSSAGGFLALLAGTGIGYAACGLEKPEPVTGIAAFYSITDLEDPFWTTKQHPVSYFKRVIGKEEVEPFISPDDTKVVSSALDSKRSIFYHYMVQEGILGNLLLDGTGISTSAFSIAPAIKSGKFPVPPTYLTHGTIDDKVPPRQSDDVVEALKEKGARIEYELFEGLDHLFDKNPSCDIEGMYAFIDKLVK